MPSKTAAFGLPFLLRRRLIGTGVLAAASPIAFAAPSSGSRRIVWVVGEPPTENVRRRFARWFEREGWVVGRDVTIDYVEPGPREYEKRARDIVASRPDAIVLEVDFLIPLFRQLTREIPLVISNFCCDAYVERLGFVRSISRPGANLTGTLQPAIIDKAYQLAKRLRPALKRIGICFDDRFAEIAGPLAQLMREDSREAASRLGLEIVEIIFPADAPVATIEQYIRKAKVDALDAWVGAEDDTTKRLAVFLERAGIVSLWPDASFVKDGGLLAVHPDMIAGALDVVRICALVLRGTKPADIPLQTIRLIHVSLNLATAKRMRIEVPPSVLTAADIVFR